MEQPSEPGGVCHSCGTAIRPADNYCQQCGAELGTRGAAQAAESPDGGSVPLDGTTGQPVDRNADWERDPAESGDSGPGAPGSKRGQESAFRAIGTAIGLSVVGLGVPLIGLSIIGVFLLSIGLPNGPVLVGMVLSQFGWFVALSLWYLRRRGYDWPTVRSYFGIERPSLKELGLVLVTWVGIIIAAGIVLTVVTQIAAQFVGPSNAEPAENSTGSFIAENPEIVFVAIAGMLLVVGPAEETLFRGVIQNRLRETLSTVPAIVIASALFASAHVFALAGGGSPTGIAITISVLFVTSLGLGGIYEYTENLVVPALLHGFHNSVVVAATVAAATSASLADVLLWLPARLLAVLSAL